MIPEILEESLLYSSVRRRQCVLLHFTGNFTGKCGLNNFCEAYYCAATALFVSDKLFLMTFS